MTATVILLTLILAALLFIANELRVIARELAKKRPFGEDERETREKPTAGQTINVNLSPLAGIAPTITSSTGTAPQAAEKDLAAESVPPPEETDKKTKPSPEGKSAPSGPFAVKCPQCQAENSSYRSECFNCGRPL